MIAQTTVVNAATNQDAFVYGSLLTAAAPLAAVSRITVTRTSAVNSVIACPVHTLAF